MVLLIGFGVIALVMSAVGVFSVTAYSISQRKQEFGIRMALGADRGRVLGMVLGQSLWPCVTGVVLGLAGSVAATRLLETLLNEIERSDPLTLFSVSLILLLVTVIACVLPARRLASRTAQPESSAAMRELPAYVHVRATTALWWRGDAHRPRYASCADAPICHPAPPETHPEVTMKVIRIISSISKRVARPGDCSINP